MKKVPTWLAINSFATGRFNQLDDTLPAGDRCRAKTRRCSQAANQLEFTLGWSSRTPSATPSKTNVLL